MEKSSPTVLSEELADHGEEPLVSCITPTRNRRNFLPKAIEYFLRQDYGNRELIILDDGDDNVQNLVPDDPRIHYEYLPEQLTLGAKRNLACEWARGEIVIHWDDDDWMAPWRIRYQVNELINESADLCGLSSLIFYSPRINRAWRYLYPKKHCQLLSGGSLCYTKALWRENSFAEVNVGEDARFTWSRRPKKLKILDNRDFYVAIIHDKNTNPLDTRRKRWSRYPVEAVRRLLGSDDTFYRNLSSRNKELKNNNIAAINSKADQPGKSIAEIEHTKPNFSISYKRTNNSAEVTVTIPYFGCANTLRRAVESILNQTHKNLRLVVVNDGDQSPWHLLQDIDDPRLILFNLGENRGRYFADAVVLSATDSKYYLIQDADDWSEQNRIEVLINNIRPKGVIAAISACQLWKQQKNGQIEKHKLLEYDKLLQPPTSIFEFRSDHHGLFLSSALRAIGGYYGGYRVGYDTLLMNLLVLTGKISYVQNVLYNRVMRPGSLTTSSSTGMTSAYRHDVRLSLKQIYKQAYGIFTQFQKGTLRAAECTNQIGELCTKYIPPDASRDIEQHARRLRALMTQPSALVSKVVAHPKHHNRQTHSAVSGDFVYELIANSDVNWNDWAISPETALFMWGRLHRLKPKRILELGSGISTLILAEYARQHAIKITTLEHSPKHYKQISEMLFSFGLLDNVDLYATELLRVACKGESPQLWYQSKLEGVYDFIFIDGPPLRYGRTAALFQLFNHLTVKSEVWLHDANRDHERECLKMWNLYFDFHTESIDVDRGLVILNGIIMQNYTINPQAKI